MQIFLFWSMGWLMVPHHDFEIRQKLYNKASCKQEPQWLRILLHLCASVFAQADWHVQHRRSPEMPQTFSLRPIQWGYQTEKAACKGQGRCKKKGMYQGIDNIEEALFLMWQCTDSQYPDPHRADCHQESPPWFCSNTALHSQLTSNTSCTVPYIEPNQVTKAPIALHYHLSWSMELDLTWLPCMSHPTMASFAVWGVTCSGRDPGMGKIKALVCSRKLPLLCHAPKATSTGASRARGNAMFRFSRPFRK